MNKIQLLIIIILCFGLGVFGYYIYSYNQEFQQDFLEHQSNIESAKNKQASIDRQFEQTQQQKAALQTACTAVAALTATGCGPRCGPS